TFTAPATVVINATASDSDGTVSKVDFYQNGIFLGTDATSPYSFTWSSVAAGNYNLTAVATDNLGATGTSPVVAIVVNPAGGGLPAPWVQQDIGNVGAAGSATYSAGAFSDVGSGDDIWNAADAFHYVYQPLTANGTIIARVASVQNTDPWAKAGIMIRESLQANSRFSMMAITPANGIVFQSRTTTGAAAVSTQGPIVSAPYWLKLVRHSKTFSGYYSTNGTSWTLLGSVTVTLSTGTYIGLPVTSHNNGILCTAVLDNVSVTSP
ncbi:MAG: Ig-like domain-containing protein, partial [Acidobacteriota bacterium]